MLLDGTGKKQTTKAISVHQRVKLTTRLRQAGNLRAVWNSRIITPVIDFSIFYSFCLTSTKYWASESSVGRALDI